MRVAVVFLAVAIAVSQAIPALCVLTIILMD